jgi:predicted aspartyl protease
VGHVDTKIRISNIERTKITEVKALADTGATLTVLPQKVAQELELGEFCGLSLRGTLVPKQSESGAGEIKLKRTSARISIDGGESVQDVLISDFIDRVLLGVVTSETLALSSDPLTGKLKEKRLLLYSLALKRSTSGQEFC